MTLSSLFGSLDGLALEDLKQAVGLEQSNSMTQVFALGRAATELLRYLEDAVSPANVSLARLRVLMAVRFQFTAEAATPALLAERVGITRASMTSMLDALEADRLIARSVHATDRRSIKIDLTPRGNALIRKALPLIAKASDNLIRHLKITSCDFAKGASLLEAALAAARDTPT